MHNNISAITTAKHHVMSCGQMNEQKLDVEKKHDLVDELKVESFMYNISK